MITCQHDKPGPTCTLPDEQVICICIPVESQLRLPGKFAGIHDGVSYKRLDYVPGVHICDDQGVDFLPDFAAELAADHGGQVSQLPGKLAAQILQ